MIHTALIFLSQNFALVATNRMLPSLVIEAGKLFSSALLQRWE